MTPPEIISTSALDPANHSVRRRKRGKRGIQDCLPFHGRLADSSVAPRYPFLSKRGSAMKAQLLKRFGGPQSFELHETGLSASNRNSA
ncbi:hypothetical protein DF035_36980 [Burkholderia contaminans]|nr:hypothetical protein DF035_36980 [Burkholderia contaminans]